MVEGLRRPQRRRAGSLLTAVAIAFVPAAVVGVVSEKVIKDVLFGVAPVVVAWIVGGVAVLELSRRGLVGPRGGRALDAITTRDAVVIGAAQVLALWPGTSRSLVTIVAALLLGMSMAAAVEFSFLLGFVTLGAATVYETAKDGKLMIDTFGIAIPLLGLVVAFVAAAVSIRWMVGYLSRHDLADLRLVPPRRRRPGDHLGGHGNDLTRTHLTSFWRQPVPISALFDARTEYPPGHHTVTTSEGARRGFGPSSAAISASAEAGRHSRRRAERDGLFVGPSGAHAGVRSDPSLDLDADVPTRTDRFGDHLDGIVRRRCRRTVDVPEVTPQRGQARLGMDDRQLHHDSRRRMVGEGGDECAEVHDVVGHVAADDDVGHCDLRFHIGPPPTYGAHVQRGRRERCARRRACPGWSRQRSTGRHHP